MVGLCGASFRSLPSAWHSCRRRRLPREAARASPAVPSSRQILSGTRGLMSSLSHLGAIGSSRRLGRGNICTRISAPASGRAGRSGSRSPLQRKRRRDIASASNMRTRVTRDRIPSQRRYRSKAGLEQQAIDMRSWWTEIDAACTSSTRCTRMEQLGVLGLERHGICARIAFVPRPGPPPTQPGSRFCRGSPAMKRSLEDASRMRFASPSLARAGHTSGRHATSQAPSTTHRYLPWASGCGFVARSVSRAFHLKRGSSCVRSRSTEWWSRITARTG